MVHHLVPDCTFQQLAWFLRSHELMVAELSWTQTVGLEAVTDELHLILEIPCTSPGCCCCLTCSPGVRLLLLPPAGLVGTYSAALLLRPAAEPAAVGSTQGTGVVKVLLPG